MSENYLSVPRVSLGRCRPAQIKSRRNPASHQVSTACRPWSPIRAIRRGTIHGRTIRRGAPCGIAIAWSASPPASDNRTRCPAPTRHATGNNTTRIRTASPFGIAGTAFARVAACHGQGRQAGSPAAPPPPGAAPSASPRSRNGRCHPARQKIQKDRRIRLGTSAVSSATPCPTSTSPRRAARRSATQYASAAGQDG